MNKLPFVRGIYNTIKQVLETISRTDTQSFKELVLVQYPHRSTYMLGLVASEGRGEVREKTSEDLINVFLPLLPNITLGFLVNVPRSQVKSLQMDVGTGLKFLMSFGIVSGEERAPALKEGTI